MNSKNLSRNSNMEVVHPLLGAFSIIKKIGNGSFASVYYANHSQLHYPVAIKIFNKQANEDDIIKTLAITKYITHPFICKDFDFFKTSSGEHCIIMEYVKGITLLRYANENLPLSEQKIHSIFGQLVIALDFLHKNNIIHRDLKCENIIIDKNRNIRLIDLNFSCQTAILHSTFCGSPAYIAPEIIKNEFYNESVDIWSLGVILYAITYGKLPFESDNYSILFNMITTQDPEFPVLSRISDSLVDLIKKMLVKNPIERIKIEGIKSHPFFLPDDNDKNYIFNQQKINYFIRDPLSKNGPDMQIIQQMHLSMENSLKAISEIKSGKISYFSMTYNILFKNHLSNVQIKNYSKSFLNSVKLKNKACKTHSEHPLLSNLERSDTKEHPQTERLPMLSRSNSDDLMSSKDNFDIETENDKHVELKVFLNCNVNFRRFTSAASPLCGISVRKRTINAGKNITLFQTKAHIKNPSASDAGLPILKLNK